MAEPYNRVRISGNLVGGEVWSINPAFAIPGGGAIALYSELLAWAGSIAGLNTNTVLPAVVRDLLSANGTITEIRCEYYDSTGKLANAAEVTLTTPVLGTGSANKTLQTSVVVSLLSGRPGRSYRGRLYLVALSLTLTSGTFRIGPSAAQSIATAMGVWLDAVADASASGAALRPVVVSKTMGVNTVVTSVAVGDVPDTQRRRRDSLAEAYSIAPVPS